MPRPTLKGLLHQTHGILVGGTATAFIFRCVTACRRAGSGSDSGSGDDMPFISVVVSDTLQKISLAQTRTASRCSLHML